MTASRSGIATKWLCLLCFCLSVTNVVPFDDDDDCRGPRTPDQLREFLWGSESNNYARRTRPTVSWLAEELKKNPARAEPETIQTQLHVLSLRSVDQTRGEITLMTWFRQKWNDYRLSYQTESFGGCFPDDRPVGFDQEDLQEIWKPDLRPVNVVSTPTQVAGSFWIYPNGDVLYTQSLLMTVSCKFEFASFPQDTQNCTVVVGTWKEDAKECQLGFLDGRDPVTVAEPSDLGNAVSGTNEWDIVHVGGREDGHNLQKAALTNESTVQFIVDIQRKYEYYADFVLVPCLLIVIMSWASFFIDRKAAPARTTMAIVCFLTNTNFLSTQLASLPRLSNDVLMLKLLTVSQIFSFYAVIEYVICNYLVRIQRRIEQGREKVLENERAMRKLCSGDDSDSTMLELEQPPLVPGAAPPPSSSPPRKSHPTKEEMIRNGYKYKIDVLLLRNDGSMFFADEHVEVFSRWAYPLAYLLSVTVIWYIHE